MENNVIDCLGKEIGTFLIFERAGVDKRGYALWNGKCKLCGNIRSFTITQIKSQRTRKCKCLLMEDQLKAKQWYQDNDYKKVLKDYLWKRVHHTYHLNPENLPPEITLRKKKENLKGQIYNGIKLLYPCGYNRDTRVMYVCQCFCGSYFIASGKNLKLGITKSCDCLRNKRVVDANMSRTDDIIGKAFGKLKVIEFAGFMEKYGGRKGSLYKCECKCGRTCVKQGVYLRCGDTQTCGFCFSSHGEIAIANLLDERKINYIHQYDFKDCNSDKNGRLYFDFAILDKEGKLFCLVEYDGEQHYNPNLKGFFENAYEGIHQRDLIKDDYCKKNNILLYRIRFDENLKERMEEILNEL